MTTNDRASLTGIGTVLFVLVAFLIVFAVYSFRTSTPRPESVAGIGPLADPALTYNPVKAGEETPTGYRQLLDRDRIAPVYDPVFVTASQVDWPDDALVIGLALDGEAKAYPVSHLNSREMVIDRLAEIPMLVTW